MTKYILLILLVLIPVDVVSLFIVIPAMFNTDSWLIVGALYVVSLALIVFNFYVIFKAVAKAAHLASEKL